MKAGQSGRCSDWEFAFVLDNLVGSINYDGLVSRVLDNSKSLLGIAAGLGLAIPCWTRSIYFCGRLIGRLPFWKNRPDDCVKWGHWSHL